MSIQTVTETTQTMKAPVGVVVYSKPNCVQCDMTYRFLDRAGIDYEKVDITEDEQAMAHAKELGYLAAPVVIVDETTHWAGFRPDRLAEI